MERVNPDELIGMLMADLSLADPYPIYEALRQEAPNHLSFVGIRFLTTYSDCQELLRSPDFSQRFGIVADDRHQTSPFFQTVREMIVLTNPPEHTRLRRLVAGAFSPRSIEQLRGKVEALVDRLLDQMAERATADLISDLAEPVPSMTLCELMGAPFSDYEIIAPLQADIANALSPIVSDETLARADKAALQFHAYLRELIAARRIEPRDDLVSQLAAVEAEGDRLTEAELVNLLFTIMAAGSETTTAAIGTGVLLLARHPSERRKLLEEPSLIRSAVDEILRYEAPIQTTFLRMADRETTVGGVTVAQGEHVVALIGAADRDPEVFEEPDRFLIDRPNAADHIAFGVGVHNCLGRSLGRLQTEVALDRLWRRFPGLELVEDEPTWQRSIPHRRLAKLLVRLG